MEIRQKNLQLCDDGVTLGNKNVQYMHIGVYKQYRCFIQSKYASIL